MTKGADIEKAYALIIGISEYKDPGIRRLNYTHADAEGIFKLLTVPKNLGLSKDNIRILLDKDATRFNINDAVSNWLYKNADEDSVVFIFFAGHGGIEKDRRGKEKDKPAAYLLPFDSVFDNLFASAISNRDFNDLLLTIRSKKLVIFMDSCYSGGVSERGARDVKIMDDPYQKLGEGEGRLVIAASQPDQPSYENSEIEHGIFTDNLLKALSGAADRDHDGYVTVLDAWKYLEEGVPRDAMKLAGGIQEPIIRGDLTRDFVISIDRERFEKIERDEIIQGNISKLLELRNQKAISGKQYARLRNIVKIDFEKLSDQDKKIANLVNDFLSEYISITTFLEDLEIIEPELFETSEKERQEQERLRRQREEERIQRVKEREKALKEEAEAKRLEQKRKEQEAQQAKLSTFYSKGTEALEAQDWQTAIEQFKEALAIDAEYRDAGARLKEAEQQLEFAEEKERQQLEEQEKAKALKEELKGLYDKGKRAVNSKDWETAIAAFREVVTLDSQYKDAAKLLALAESELKKIEERKKQREEQEAIPREKEVLKDIWDNSRQIVNIKTIQYVKSGQKEIVKSGFLGFGRKKELVYDLVEKEIENQIEIRQNSIGMEFVLIPAGEFDMGSPSNEVGRYASEGPVRHVKLASAFYMGKYEVTQKQWRDVMGTSPSSFKGDDLPVEQVSWNDAQEFIKKLNEKEGTNKYRLPSEAEWEYAARAETTARYFFGDDESKLGDYAWFYSNSGSNTHEVGQKKPNPWGLYDMHGNVWEWVQDIYHSSYNGAPTDGRAWEGDGSYRVIRGGGWDNFAWGCRSAFRFSDDPGGRDDDLGFRLLRIS